MQPQNNRYIAIAEIPMPACVVDEDGLIIYANKHMNRVILFDDILGSNFFALTGIKREQLELNQEDIYIERNEKTFKLCSSQVPNDDCLIVYFDDQTNAKNYDYEIEQTKPVILFLSIDNYDALTSSITTDSKRAVPTEIDRVVRKWADEYDSPICSVSDDEYVMFTDKKHAQIIIDDKFSVLDLVRQIDTKVDFPVSLSIGMGMSAVSALESRILAESARELALGRGGDQAVVKEDDHTQIYGGTLQSMERNTKGKARVIAHALKNLILDADSVFIMGHKYPDMDSFGAAIGAYSMCKNLGCKAYIVMGDETDGIAEIIQSAKETDDYGFITPDKAKKLAKKNTLLIIVDANRESLLECPELIDICNNITVLDHHRMTETSISKPTLAYIESYASSASELISEILQYFSSKKIITKFEAETLLAGIMVDTNNFSIRSGVRTFEAAAYLRRCGADSMEVKRFFQTPMKEISAKANAVLNAEYYENGIAFAILKPDFGSGAPTNQKIINAKVADELLGVKGVQLSFSLTQENQQTLISARSLGGYNVQSIMEEFGGGGHLTSAACQLDANIDEALKQLKQSLKIIAKQEV